MTYRVVLQRLAKQDLREAYEWAAEQAPATAGRWLARFEQALQTLEQTPDRCPLARENVKVDVEVREFLFGKRPYVFRVIFIVNEQVVRILRIPRAQRRFLTAREVEEALKIDDEQ